MTTTDPAPSTTTAPADAPSPEVRYEVADHIATITLDAPERMNTISGPMLGAISTYLLEADRDRDVRCIVLTGSGRAFCAGLDLAAQAKTKSGGLGNLGTPSGGAGEFDLRDAPPTVLHNVDTPTICALNGGAAGYGLDLALGCDIRIAAASAKLAPGFAKRGILPESGGTWLLPRMIGYAKAAEIAFRGNTLTAAESLELGIVNHAVPDDEFRSFTAQVAGEIAANAAARRAGDQAHDARRRDRDVRAERAPRVPPAAAAARHERLQGRRRRVHGEAAGGVHRFMSRRRSATSGCWRRWRRRAPSAATGPIRSPTRTSPRSSGTRSVPRRARTGSGSASSRCGATTRRPRRRASCSPSRSGKGWVAKRAELDRDGEPEEGSARFRMQAAMQHYVDHFDTVPVVVLVGLERYRPPDPSEGASVYPACQNLLLAARALGYGGVMTGWHAAVEAELRELIGLPDGVALCATITLGVPMGRHGPLRRKPLVGLVHDGRWGRPATWLGERGRVRAPGDGERRPVRGARRRRAT